MALLDRGIAAGLLAEPTGRNSGAQALRFQPHQIQVGDQRQVIRSLFG